MDVLVEILKGGAAKVAEAGISVIGGHTIEDPEPKYGMVGKWGTGQIPFVMTIVLVVGALIGVSWGAD